MVLSRNERILLLGLDVTHYDYGAPGNCIEVGSIKFWSKEHICSNVNIEEVRSVNIWCYKAQNL